MVELVVCHTSQSIHTEVFDGEAGDDPTVDYCLLEKRHLNTTGACEKAHEAAGKAVARARWILDLLKQERGRQECPIARHHHTAILAPLDEHDLRPERHDLSRRGSQAVVLGILANL